MIWSDFNHFKKEMKLLKSLTHHEENPELMKRFELDCRWRGGLAVGVESERWESPSLRHDVELAGRRRRWAPGALRLRPGQVRHHRLVPGPRGPRVEGFRHRCYRHFLIGGGNKSLELMTRCMAFFSFVVAVILLSRDTITLLSAYFFEFGKFKFMSIKSIHQLSLMSLFYEIESIHWIN